MKMLSYPYGQTRALRRGLQRAAASSGTSAGARSFKARLRARLRSGEEGQSLVEFALLLPLLAMTLTGVFMCGIAFMNYVQLTNAVDSGARFLQTVRSSTTDPCNQTFTAITNAAPYLASHISVTINLNGVGTTGTAVQGPFTGSASCPGSENLMVWKSPATVYATYPCSLLIAFSGIGSSCTLKAESTQYLY